MVQAARLLHAAGRSVSLSRVGSKRAEAAYVQISARYRVGAIGVLDMLEAESLRVEAELRSIEAHIAAREQDLRLRHALGEIARPSEPARGDTTG